jgi:diguanylate cyclase (GGDEF)-like protein
MRLNRKSISKAIIILPIIGIIITSLLITGVAVISINQAFEKQKQETTEKFMQDLKKTTKEKVDMTYNIIDFMYKKYLSDFKNREKVRQKVIKIIPKFFNNFKWKKAGYVFIIDLKGNIIYHIRPELIGKNMWNLVVDGKKLTQFVINRAIHYPKGSYVEYIPYTKEGNSKKVDYIKLYKPLNIVIASGVYLSLNKDLLEIQNKEHKLLMNLLKKFILISLLSLIIMSGIIFLLSKKLQNLFLKYEKELQKEKEKFKKKAYFDNLTNFYTRYGAKYEFEKIKKSVDANHKKTAILFIDLDHFKDINDSLGHNIGDEILKVVANRLKKCVTIKDKVIRFGGDEFIIILNEIKDEKEIKELVEKILLVIKFAINVNNKNFYISASIGITIYPDDSNDFETLIRFAGSAMYKAKERGKDRYMFFKQEISNAAYEKLRLKNEIRKAIEKEEFEIYFQPQIDKNEKVYGAEVLIRWNHPKKGIISPFYFIPLAIEAGIIDKIDLWVIESAIKQHIKWQEKGYYPVLSCNVTVYQLEKGVFADNLKKLLHKYNFDAKYLNIEVTEEGIMKNPELSIKMLNKVNDLGVKINIDDFGTGYSSFAYLKKLPVNKLKIDREFIKDIPDDKDDEVITKSMITLAKNMNLKSVAEGVETKEELDFVLSNGCDYIQGYFYSPPIPADKFEEKFLKDNK